ncbi:MAG: methyl-coenzyme M reductase family protein [Methanobacterium sp.]|uniref:methyl-coenzyme M reductase family protein n=1 Tax=Methanobacterium sp. TaxID=2164 RepID=UPI003C7230A7
MYILLGYSSGVYKFNEMVEFVEDVGGIVLTRDEFHISRGSYFISQEVHVILVIPEEALSDVKEFAKELKGDIEYLDVDREQKINVLSIIPVYNLLSHEGSWVDIETLQDIIECPCITEVCKEFEGTCLEDMDKTLDAMKRMDIVETRDLLGVIEYKLKS